MKTRVIVLAAIALLAALLLAAACGGGGEQAGIRTQKGLAVAALAAAAERGGDDAGGASDTSVAPGAPSAETGFGFGGEGVVSPDSAPFPFPAPQQSQAGVTVQGFGSASADADSAVVELYFGGEPVGIEPLPEPDFGRSEPGSGGVAPGLPETETSPRRAGEITEADLQPVVDAIVAQGVPRADIEVIVDPSFGGSATIRVTASNADAVDGIVNAAADAASGLEGIFFDGSSVSYAVSDCAALEMAAMQAAVEDARERGQSFAAALGVGLGAVTGATHFSSSLFGGSPCDSGFGGPFPLGGAGFARGGSQEVQLIAMVTITFAIQ